jgi:deoxyribodipyrimidine photo-lyase
MEDSSSFLEELVVRRELSDNFCYYNSNYDTFDGFPDWAKETLRNMRRTDANIFTN